MYVTSSSSLSVALARLAPAKPSPLSLSRRRGLPNLLWRQYEFRPPSPLASTHSALADPPEPPTATVVSKLGALIVLDSILNRPIDLDSIPTQEPAKGVTPGGTVDLAGAGVRIPAPQRREQEQVGLKGVMEEEEMEEREREERERVLNELLGGQGGAQGGEGRVRFELNETGGFVR